MSNLKWIDRSQPQTLQGAVIFCYINAIFTFLGALAYGFSPLVLPLLALGVFGYFIAQEKRWAYWSSVAVASLYALLLLFVFFLSQSLGVILNLAFIGVLVALLLHVQSRNYQKIWFH